MGESRSVPADALVRQCSVRRGRLTALLSLDRSYFVRSHYKRGDRIRSPLFATTQEVNWSCGFFFTLVIQNKVKNLLIRSSDIYCYRAVNRAETVATLTGTKYGAE